MSSHPGSKAKFWTGCLLGFGILVAMYLLAVRIEESAYETSKGQWTTYTGENSPLKYDQVDILLTDKKGNLWIGTEWGLCKIDSNGTWETFTTANSDLLDDTIRALAVDRSGNLWVAGAGLHVVDPNGQWTTIHPGRDWEAIHALAFDNQGRTWIGTFGGLIVLDANGDERVYTKENSGLVNNSVTALAVDQQDRVWIGTFGYGVNVLDPQGHWTTYREGGQHLRLDEDNIQTFFIDPQEQVWIGTSHGLKIISPDGSQTSSTGLQWGITPSSIITVESFALDKQNRMWMEMAGRLVVVDSEKNSLVTYSWNNSGLPGVVSSLAIDQNEKLWIGTIKGLSVIDLKQGLPDTIPDRWLSRRKILRAPRSAVPMFGGLLFLPLFIKGFRFWYVFFLMLGFIAALGIKKGSTEKNSKLSVVSWSALIFIFIGLVVTWLLSAMMAMMD